MYGDAMARAMSAVMVMLVAGGVAVGALAVWLIPLLWAWVKPFIHSWTG